MRIELTNRKYWLEKIESKLENIYEMRQKEIERYNGLPWWKQLGETDPNEWVPYWMSEAKLKNIQQALLTDNTGVIYVTSEELEEMR